MYKETVMSKEDCPYQPEGCKEELWADLGAVYQEKFMQGASKQAKLTWDIAEKAGYEKGVKAQKTPRTDLECELADEEFRREFRIARKDTDMEMYKAGIQKVVDYFSRHWMGQTRQMMLYEIPAKDRDLLEDGIIPDDARKPDSGKPSSRNRGENEY